MIKLSYSTIKYTLQPDNSHNWLNKQMGFKVPDNEFFQNGHRIHRIIQDYLCGKVDDPRLAHIAYKFPIVEEKDFDERCSFLVEINDKYAVRGFIDALDPDNKRLGEIKTSSDMWGVAKFVKSYQRKIYALGKPDFTESILITAISDDNRWNEIRPKTFKVPLTEKDRKEALDWIKQAIDLLEKGDFTGGLTDGKCLNKFCYYGVNCQFK